ncbi:hypothetical protein AVEN_179187-1 [Araneus ventricosus]|uniref:Uncharacterized protein n=1 Tax=Araneus ventricosus TaxID=182803 RepID=A0A4Y2C7P2_ARAVE|nr:hypothetical protein AVEN_179187-1 [Araneus ventricosus]
MTDSVPIATPFFRWWNSQDRVHFEFFTNFSRTQQKKKSSTFPDFSRTQRKITYFSGAPSTANKIQGVFKDRGNPVDREEILVIDSVTIATPFFATPPSFSKLEKSIVIDSIPIAPPFFRWWNSQDSTFRIFHELFKDPTKKSSTFPDFSRNQRKIKYFSGAPSTANKIQGVFKDHGNPEERDRSKTNLTYL